MPARAPALARLGVTSVLRRSARAAGCGSRPPDGDAGARRPRAAVVGDQHRAPRSITARASGAGAPTLAAAPAVEAQRGARRGRCGPSGVGPPRPRSTTSTPRPSRIGASSAPAASVPSAVTSLTRRPSAAASAAASPADGTRAHGVWLDHQHGSWAQPLHRPDHVAIEQRVAPPPRASRSRSAPDLHGRASSRSLRRAGRASGATIDGAAEHVEARGGCRWTWRWSARRCSWPCRMSASGLALTRTPTWSRPSCSRRARRRARSRCVRRC